MWFSKSDLCHSRLQIIWFERKRERERAQPREKKRARWPWECPDYNLISSFLLYWVTQREILVNSEGELIKLERKSRLTATVSTKPTRGELRLVIELVNTHTNTFTISTPCTFICIRSACGGSWKSPTGERSQNPIDRNQRQSPTIASLLLSYTVAAYFIIRT